MIFLTSFYTSLLHSEIYSCSTVNIVKGIPNVAQMIGTHTLHKSLLVINALCKLQFTLHIAHYTLYITHYTLHTTHCRLNTADYTL